MLRSAVLTQLAIEHRMWDSDQAANIYRQYQSLGDPRRFEQWAEANGVLKPTQALALVDALAGTSFQCIECMNVVMGRDLAGVDDFRCPHCNGPSFTRTQDRQAETRLRIPAVVRKAKHVPADGSQRATPVQQAANAETPTRVPTIGNWQLVDLAGKGGTGSVYKAFNAVLNRYAAVKVLDHSFEGTARRFQLEARIYASLDHPNIVKVFDFGEQDSQPYIVMEWVDGQSLRQLVEHNGPIAPDDMLPLAAQICEGLHAAHKAGVIHRDIKPDNIMVTPDGHVKITDFGLAKYDQSKLRITSTGVILGTPLYMAPEQILQQPLAPATDIYALGLTLFFALTGHDAFDGSTHFAMMNRHLTEDLPPLDGVRDLPLEFAALLDRMCKRHPADRPATAKDISRQLRALYLGESTASGSNDAVSQPDLHPNTIGVITVRGKYETNDWFAVEAAIDTATAHGIKHFVINLAECLGIHSTGLGMLVRVSDRLDEAGGKLVLAAINSRVHIVFDMMGLVDHFATAPTIEAAINQLGGGQTLRV